MKKFITNSLIDITNKTYEFNNNLNNYFTCGNSRTIFRISAIFSYNIYFIFVL